MKTVVITGSARGLGFNMARFFREYNYNVVISDLKEDSEKTKKVYNILGDTPETVGKFLVDKMVKNTKNNVKINWLTNSKAFKRFLTAGFNKRNFFAEDQKLLTENKKYCFNQNL